MPLPLGDILRDREANASLHGVEPSPDVQPEAPQAPVAPAEAPPMPLGTDAMSQGAGMRLDAAQSAIAQNQANRQALVDAQQQSQAQQAPFRQQLQATLAEPQPEPPETPELPVQPSLAGRPFLEGGPNDSPWQSIQNAINGISLLVQMGFGAANGVPEMSLKAMKGALEGWHEGDMERGDREFKEWQASVQRIQRDYENQRKRYEAIAEKHKGNVEDQRLALLVAAAEGHESQEYLKAIAQSDESFYQLMDRQGQVVEDLGKTQEALGIKRDQMKAVEARAAADAAKWQAKFEQDAQQFKESMAQRQQSHADTMGIQRERLELDKQKALGENKALSAATGEKLAAYQEAATSLDVIKALKNDPKTRKEIESYLGPVGSQKRLLTYIPGQLGGKIPESVVKFDQALANLNNTALKARSGSQVTLPEQQRFNKEFPQTYEPTAMFWDRLAAVERNYLQAGQTFKDVTAPGKPDVVVQPKNPQAAPQQQGAPDSREGTISKSGKYIWKGGEWQPR